MKKICALAAAMLLCLGLCACTAVRELPASAQLTALQSGMTFYTHEAFVMQIPETWAVQENPAATANTPFVMFLAPDGNANVNIICNTLAEPLYAQTLDEAAAKEIVEGVNASAGCQLQLMGLEHKMLGEQAAAVLKYGGDFQGTEMVFYQQMVPVGDKLYCITYTAGAGSAADMQPLMNTVVFR